MLDFRKERFQINRSNANYTAENERKKKVEESKHRGGKKKIQRAKQ